MADDTWGPWGNGAYPYPPRCSHPRRTPQILDKPEGKWLCPDCHVDLNADGTRILDPEILAFWTEHWEEIVTDRDGNLDLQQVQAELHDYWHCIEQVPMVYGEITGNAMSKPHYTAQAVIEVHNERCPNVTALIEDIREVLEGRGDHEDMEPLHYDLPHVLSPDPVAQRFEALEEVLERHETLHSAEYRRQREEAAPT